MCCCLRSETYHYPSLCYFSRSKFRSQNLNVSSLYTCLVNAKSDLKQRRRRDIQVWRQRCWLNFAGKPSAVRSALVLLPRSFSFLFSYDREDLTSILLSHLSQKKFGFWKGLCRTDPARISAPLVIQHNKWIWSTEPLPTCCENHQPFNNARISRQELTTPWASTYNLKDLPWVPRLQRQSESRGLELFARHLPNWWARRLQIGV